MIVESEEFIPLRAVETEPDELDQDRIRLVIEKRWKPQDGAYAAYSQMVEGHIRMLSGRHWDQWSPWKGKYINALDYMTESERKYRHRPVMDYLAYWFMLTLSKVTENPPMVGILPANADRQSAMLAEVMEPIHKHLFEMAEMDATNIKVAAWTLCAGQAYVASHIDFDAGETEEAIGDANLSLDRPDGTRIERTVPGVPFDKAGNPLATMMELSEDQGGGLGYDVTGDPHQAKEGELRTTALCPLEVRGEWGMNIPHNRKRWLIHRWFLPKSAVKSIFGVDVEPDSVPEGDSGAGYLERMLFGSGYFGNATRPVADASTDNTELRQAFVCGYTMWEKPDFTPDEATGQPRLPKGRLLVVTETKVLIDSARPYQTEAAGPIRRTGFSPIPGRPFDSTPLERMVPIQKRIDRLEAQIAEHTDKCSDPVLFVDISVSDIDGDDLKDVPPGSTLEFSRIGPGEPAFYLAPAALGADVWTHKANLVEQLFIIGGMAGQSGEPPSTDPSGKLVEALRFNGDRPITPLTRSLVMMNADVVQDWVVMLPTMWTKEKVISFVGNDSVIRTVTVLPEMFEGAVKVKAVIESASAESREAKLARVQTLYELGAFGQPGTPAAIGKLLELSRYPDLDRASRPGGINRITAEQNLGKLAQGTPYEQLAVLEVYDLSVHIQVTEEHMSSPEYLKYSSEIQTEFQLYLETLKGAAMVKQIRLEQQGAALGAVQASLAGSVQKNAVASGPPQEDGSPDSAAGKPKQRPAKASGPQGAAA